MTQETQESHGRRPLRRMMLAAVMASTAIALWGCGEDSADKTRTVTVPRPAAPAFDPATPHSIKDLLPHLKSGTYSYVDAPDKYGPVRKLSFCLGKRAMVQVTERDYLNPPPLRASSEQLRRTFPNYPSCADNGALDGHDKDPGTDQLQKPAHPSDPGNAINTRSIAFTS